MNASTGENIISAVNEKMFASPILAPGTKRGGNWFSIINVIKLSVIKIASTAIFLAVNFPLFILFYYTFIIFK